MQRWISHKPRLNLVFGSNSRPAGDIIEEVAQDEPEMPKLTADVRITSNGVSLDEAITAEPRSVLHRRFETVLPFVEIPTVTDRTRVERMIDLLGKRLVEVPASLTLAPTASDPTLPDAGRELLLAQARELARLLQEVTKGAVAVVGRGQIHIASGLDKGRRRA